MEWLYIYDRTQNPVKWQYHLILSLEAQGTRQLFGIIVRHDVTWLNSRWMRGVFLTLATVTLFALLCWPFSPQTSKISWHFQLLLLLGLKGLFTLLVSHYIPSAHTQHQIEQTALAVNLQRRNNLKLERTGQVPIPSFPHGKINRWITFIILLHLFKLLASPTIQKLIHILQSHAFIFSMDSPWILLK